MEDEIRGRILAAESVISNPQSTAEARSNAKESIHIMMELLRDMREWHIPLSPAQRGVFTELRRTFGPNLAQVLIPRITLEKTGLQQATGAEILERYHVQVKDYKNYIHRISRLFFTAELYDIADCLAYFPSKLYAESNIDGVVIRGQLNDLRKAVRNLNAILTERYKVEPVEMFADNHF